MTAGQVICKKNEKLTVENTDMNKISINLECSDHSDNFNKIDKPSKLKHMRTKSSQDLKTRQR